MMNKKTLLIICGIIIIAILFVVFGRGVNKNLISADLQIKSASSPAAAGPSPTPVLPTPTPIVLNKTSDLESELQKLTPADFAGDFKSLRELSF